MMSAGIVGALIIILFVLFAKEWRPPEVSAAAVVALLLLLQILSIEDVLGVLSSPALTTIAAMIIVSTALVRTGAVQAFTQLVLQSSKLNPFLAIALFLIAVAMLSAVMNNTPLVILMIPVAIALARSVGQSSSRILIPLSYASILGGTCTLLGTSTNILVSSIAVERGLEPFHIFEIAPVGIVAALLGVAFLIAAKDFLPDRTAPIDLAGSDRNKKYIVQGVIEEGSRYVGENAMAITAFNRPDVRLIDVLRGDDSLRRDMASVVLQPGDVIVLRSNVAEILSLKDKGEIEAEADERLQPIQARNSTLAEFLVVPDSKLLGRTLGSLRLRRRYGVYPIALHRRGSNIMQRFETTPLMVGDTILTEGAPDDLSRVVEAERVLNVTEPETQKFHREKAPLAIAILLGVVAASALGLLPIAAAAVVGAAVVLVTGCVDVEEAVQAIDWRILALIASMLALGVAMEKTGLVHMVVDALAPTLMTLPPFVALAFVYAISTVLTELVTNNAVAAIITPLAIGLAVNLGVDPRPFVITVMFAASMSFITPIGYQTNTLVYSAGGYRFADFFRLGIAMDIIVACVALTLIPLIWPLT